MIGLVVITYVAEINVSSDLKKNIQEKLDTYKMNSSDLERKAGLSPTAVRKILLGTSLNPTLETIKAIASVFDCSIDELVGTRIVEERNKVSDAFLEKHNIDIKLFNDIVNFSCDHALSHKQDININDFMSFITETYKYCTVKKNSSVDKDFIEWFFSQKFKS